MSARKRKKSDVIRPVSLLILEGETEEVFYPIIRDRYLAGLRYEQTCIKGLGRINLQVLQKILFYLNNNPQDFLRVYCCIDTERGKRTGSQFDIEAIRRNVIDKGCSGVLSIDGILADPELESWFFYDIEGIYQFLQTPKAKRSVKKYANPSCFGKNDLKSLFRQFDKQYREGKRSRHFVENLDIDKILAGCTNLRKGIELIKAQSQDMTNHIIQS